MNEFQRLPTDMLSELVRNLSYSETVRLCETDRRFATYCRQNRQLLNDKLLQEAINTATDESDQVNLDIALVYALQYNNNDVARELIIQGARPYNIIQSNRFALPLNAPSRRGPNARSEVNATTQPNIIITEAINNRNIDIIRNFVNTINYSSDLSNDEKEYLISFIIDQLFQANLIDEYLIDKYPQYITPEMLFNAIAEGHPIYSTIFDNIDKFILTNESNRDISADFFLILILYTIAYQPEALVELLRYAIANNEFDLDDPTIGPDFAKILRSFENRTLFEDLLDDFKITKGRGTIEPAETLAGAILRHIRTLVTPDQPYSPSQPSREQLTQNRLNQLTIAELKQLATSLGIRVPSKLRKPEIVALLLDTQVNVPLTENLTPYRLRQIADILKLPTTLEMDRDQLLSLVRTVICP